MFDNIFIAPTARQECMRRDFAIFCPRKLQNCNASALLFLIEIKHFYQKAV